MAKVDPGRRRKRFETDFGGKDYHAFIVSLPCDICGIQGFTDPAHLRSRGAGGKADIIAPLCHSAYGIEGCHEKYDRHHIATRAHEPRLRKLARERYKAFQELIKENEK